MSRDFMLEIQTNAARLREMHALIHATFARRDESAERCEQWRSACVDFHARYDALAFPGGSGASCARVRAGDPDAIEAALAFLEIRPYFFRSGYMHKKLLRYVKHAPLSDAQAERVEALQARKAAWRFVRRPTRT